MEARKITGYFGEQNGRSVEGPVLVTCTGGAKGEMLSLAFAGQYQVTVALRAVERLVNEARLELRRAAAQSGGNGAKGTIEQQGLAEGYCTDGRVRLQKGTTAIWFRTNGAFEMLTLSHGDRGQISVPFAPVWALVRAERSSFA